MEDYTDLTVEDLIDTLHERDTLIDELNDYIDRQEELYKIQLNKQELITQKHLYDSISDDLFALMEVAAALDIANYNKILRRVDRIKIALGRKLSR